MCSVTYVTTDEQQLGLVTPEQELQAYEAIISLRLESIRAWTALPDERTDWALESLLDELASAALAVRRLRNDRELPF